MMSMIYLNLLLKNRDFEFQTASEKAFEDLVKTAKREKYYELAE